jgi:hypothetical protein
MKKSSIILVVVCVILVSWMVILQIISSKAIHSYASGKPSIFVLKKTYAIHNPMITRYSLPPFSELEVRGIGNISLNLRMAAAYALYHDILLSDRVKSHMEFNRLVIELPGFSEKDEGAYTITAPLIKKIILNHVGTTRIDGFRSSDIILSAHDVYPLSFKNCILGSLSVETQDKIYTQFLEIDSTNFVEHLSITMNGSGMLKLGTTGTLSNKISISDSIEIHTNGRLLKMLNIAGTGK